MVVDQPATHLLEGDQRRRGDDAGLAHRAAEHLADAPGFDHGVGVAAQDRADGSGEALREAELDRVDVAHQRAGVDAERRGGVEDARAVEVHPQAAGVREVRDRLGLLRGDDRATAVVVRVLETEERRAWVHALRPYRGSEILERREAVAVGHQARHDAPDHKGRAHLVLHDVREVAQDDLVAALRLREHATEVAHHAARHVDRRVFAEDLGAALLEAVHRRILAVLIVADVGLGHRLPHRQRRLGERVAAKLDDLHKPATSFARATIATRAGATRIAGR